MTTRIGTAVRRVRDAPVDRHSMVGLRLGITVLALVLSVWAFGGLLEEVLDDATLVHWDRVAHVWVHAHASAAGLAFFNAITTLGSVGVWVVVVVAALWLWRSGHRLLLSVWLGTNVGGLLVHSRSRRSSIARGRSTRRRISTVTRTASRAAMRCSRRSRT